jgi:hypothetical protein
MKKLIVILALAIATLSTSAVAEPPMPTCFPCDASR